MKTRVVLLFGMSALLISSSSFSNVVYKDVNSDFKHWYIAGKAGLLQGSFYQNYLDQTDAIPQNISVNTQQNGYTGGLAIGYLTPTDKNYLLGGELSANLDSHQSTYQSGGANSAFSDTIQIKSHIDLTFTPGILLTESVRSYLKIGVSYAAIADYLTSPVGFSSTMTSYNSHKNLYGIVVGLGAAKYLSNHWSLFAEGNYRDYGTVTLAPFQNFSANYTHTAHVYASSLEVGAAYHF